MRSYPPWYPRSFVSLNSSPPFPPFFPFFVGWRIPNWITGPSGWCVSDESRRTQETVPDRCKPSWRHTRCQGPWIRAHNRPSDPCSLAEALFAARNSALKARRFRAYLLLHTTWVCKNSARCLWACMHPRANKSAQSSPLHYQET